MSRTQAFGLLLAIACLAPASAQTANPDPYAIFSGARTYWLRQHYPAEVGYIIAVDVLEAGTHKVQHYTRTFDAVHGGIGGSRSSDYQLLHPASGRGVRLSFLFWRIGRADPPVDFIGVPWLAPNYSFGVAPFVPSDAHPKTTAEIIHDIRAEFNDLTPTPAPTATPRDSGIPEIAVVSAVKRRYDIRFAGIEQIGGAAVYHLTLRPLGNPHTFRLRELWVDTTTFATRRLVNAGNFVDGPWPGMHWTVDFATVAGALYVAQERSSDPVAFGDLRYLDTRVSFEDIRVLPARRNAEYGNLVPVQRGDIAEEPRIP